VVKRSPEIEISALERQHLNTDELRMAIIVIQTFPNAALTQRYWFKCRSCTFDWPSWF
jgi:hypothetical protein